jgi:UPF0148 protein
MKNPKTPAQTDMAKMSKLLLSGATMLNDSCPDCKIPLFKKDEKIFCPQCEREALYVKNDSEVKQLVRKFTLEESTLQLRDILTGKMNYLTNQLASSENMQEMINILEVIDKILTIMQKLP